MLSILSMIFFLSECEDDDDNKGDEAEELDSDSHKPEESDNESETQFQAAAKSKKLAPQGLRIKLSLKPVRKSTREHRATRVHVRISIVTMRIMI